MKKSVVVFLARLYDHRNALLLGNALSETKKKEKKERLYKEWLLRRV